MWKYLAGLMALLLALMATPAIASNNMPGTDPDPGVGMRAIPMDTAPGARVVANADLGCGVSAGTQGTYWGTNEYEPPAYVVWDSGGGCAAAIPVTAPFGVDSPEHAKAYWVYWDGIDLVGGVTDPTGTCEPATLSADLSALYLPVLDYNTPFGVMRLWVRMQHVPTDDGNLWFIVNDYGFLPD